MQKQISTLPKLHQIIIMIIVIMGVMVTLHFVLTGLRFFYGVDYHLFYEWQKEYMRTGVFYPENTVFFNFPLTVIAFGPYGFLPIDTAVTLKFIQTAIFCAFSVFLLLKIRPGIFTLNNPSVFSQQLPVNVDMHCRAGFRPPMTAGESPPYGSGPGNSHISVSVHRDLLVFTTILILGSFFLAQLVYLNIYAEVGVCLLLSLYYHEKENIIAASFFMSLAVIFKVFLFPLLIIPVVVRNARFLKWTAGFMAGLIILSVLIFGLKTHADMFRAMTETYAKMRMAGIGYPFVADGFAGWQDTFSKFMVVGLISRDMVKPLMVTVLGLYGCVSVYALYLMISAARTRLNDPDFYLKVFASLVILSIGFNYRFDHGTLFLCAVPFFGWIHGENRRLLTVSLTFMTLSRFFIVKIFQFLGIMTVARVFSNCFFLVSFQFIGINLMVYLVLKEWIMTGKEDHSHE